MGESNKKSEFLFKLYEKCVVMLCKKLIGCTLIFCARVSHNERRRVIAPESLNGPLEQAIRQF